MNSGTALAGVQAQAGCGIGMIGKLRALVEIDGGVGFSRGDDLDPTSGEKGAQADVEGEVGVLFELTAVKMSSGVVAAVRSVEDDNEAGG